MPDADQAPRSGAQVLLVRTAYVAVVLVLVAMVVVPWVIRSRPYASRVSCVALLRQIEGAKEQWALENKVELFSYADPRMVAEYIKGQEVPKCPQAGNYFVNAVGLPPQCSITNHTLLSFCSLSLPALNNAVALRLKKRPEEAANPNLTDMFGFGSPLDRMPVCERGGKYTYNAETKSFSCSLGEHGL